MGERLQHNAFRRALALDSSETPNDLKGDIYALVDTPFSTFGAALKQPKHWCDVLILSINTKSCRAATERGSTSLTVHIGKKTPQPLKEAYPIAFAYRLTAASANYLEIRLDAQDGPLGTRDYRIHLQAIPLGNRRTFMHLGYSYAYGMAGRLAMQTYLATLGRGKVGFTRIGSRPDGQPEYIGGMRGLAERNTMRYYLAVDAFLGALKTPAPLQLEQRLQHWFKANEQYPRQLREVSRTAYLEMKRSEYLRQQTLP